MSDGAAHFTAVYRSLMDNLNDALYVIDPERVITFITPVIREILGYEPEEIVGRPFEELVHPDDRGRVLDRFKEFARGPLDPAEYRMLHKDGRVRWIRASSRPVFEKKRFSGLRGVFTDITECRRAEEASLHATEQFQTLNDAMADGVVVGAIDTLEILWVNRAACQMFGCTEAKLLQMHVPDLHRVEDWPKVREHFMALSVGNRTLAPDIPCVSRKRKVFHVDIVAQLAELGGRRCLVGVFRDITGRRQAEAELHRLTARHEAILGEIPDIVMEVDDRKVYTWANAAGLEFFGPDVLGREASDYFEGEQDTYDRVKPLFNGDANTFYVESWQRRKDGQKRLLAWWCRALRDASGQVTGALSTARDITDQERAEELMVMLKHSIDRHDDGVYWMDRDNRFVYVNDAACRALGYTREELLGRSVADVNPVATPERMEKVWERLRNSGSFLSESVHRRKDGTEFPVEISSAHVLFGGREYNCGFARDVTEKKKALEASRAASERIRLSEAALRAAQAVAHVGSWTWHVQEDRVDWSDEMYCIFGLDKETFTGNLGEVIDRAIHPDDRAAVEASNRSVAEQGKPVPLEYRVIRPDGTVRTVWAEAGKLERDESGRPLLLTGIVQDITERKKAESEIKHSEHRYRTIVENLNDAFYIHDFQGAILDCNDNACRMTGYTRDELLKGGLLLIDGPENAARMSGSMQRLIATGRLEFEGMHIRKDGSAVLVSVSGRVVSREGGGVVQSFVRDITERKREEQAINAIVETSHDWIWTMNLSGRHTYSNHAVENILGYSPAEFEGKGLDLVHPDDRAWVESRWPGWIEARQGWTNVVLRWRNRDGRYRHLESTAVPILGPRGELQGWRGVDRDITERKEAEQAVRDGAAKLSSIFRVAPTGIGVVQNRMLTDVNERISEMTGYSREELLGRSARMLYPTQQDFDYVGQEKYRQIQESGTGTVETRWQRKDGRLIHVLLSSTPIDPDNMDAGVTFTALDITDRKNAADALRQSEEKFQRAFQSSPVLMAISTLDEGRFVDVNEAFLTTLGYRRDEVIGRTSRDLNLFADFDRRDAILKTLKEKGTVRNFDVVVRTRDGERRDGMFAAEVVELQGRRYLLTVMNDTTERKQLLAELTQKNKELETLIYAASHDLRTPLVNLQGFSQRLDRICIEFKRMHEEAGDLAELKQRAAPLLEDRVPASLGFIRASVARMDVLISGLLQLSRVGRSVLRPEALDMNHMLESILAAMTFQVQQAGAKVELTLLPPCRGDSGQINRVFSNLLDNALKYRDPARPLQIRLSGRQDRDRVFYTVSDTGRGIPSECLEKVWELFYRLDPQGPETGDGLGLTLARRIIERHNGKIWVESTPGEGSRFIVELPTGAGLEVVTSESTSQ